MQIGSIGEDLPGAMAVAKQSSIFERRTCRPAARSTSKSPGRK